MIKSMTGFGKVMFETSDKKLTVEIKSLNSKQMDISTRLPGIYKEKDIELRTLLSQYLKRGKVEFSLYLENLGESGTTIINESIVEGYVHQMRKIAMKMGIHEPSDYFQSILRLPDSTKTEILELDETEWQLILKNIYDALEQLDKFRLQEGAALEKDLRINIEEIEMLSKEVVIFEEERIQNIKNKLSEALNELKSGTEYNPDRLEQELIFYLERYDINEEKVRLGNHLHYFLDTLNSDDFVGKKLGFIAQEIGREINTMGSKAYHTEIQKLVIRMKDALEKIKEQLLNVL